MGKECQVSIWNPGYNFLMAGHTHGATSGRLLWISLGLTAAFVVAEVFFGLRAHSLALLSDAGHNASDALALGLAAYAVWVARRPANSGKTFGYHRVAILTALINATTLIVIALGILGEAWQSFLHPHPVQGSLMIEVAVVAVLMNTVIAYWLQGDAHSSLNSRAAFVHMAGDALSSLGVVIAGVVIKYTNWPLADPLVSVLIAAFIFHSSWGIIGEATNILLEGAPKGLDLNALVRSMLAVPPVCGVHDLHVWTVGDGMHFLSCHVVLPDTVTMEESASVTAALNASLQEKFGIGHATIQTEAAHSDACRAHELYCALDTHQHEENCAHTH